MNESNQRSAVSFAIAMFIPILYSVGFIAYKHAILMGPMLILFFLLERDDG